MSEVSQLSEMNAVLIASKEDNDRKRQEASEMTKKIAELEKRLEEQVAFTSRYRDAKTAATSGLQKRLDTLQDLLLKLDHVAKQTSDGYASRLSLIAEGIQGHEEGAAAYVPLDLAAAFERLTRAVQRHNEAKEQEIKTNDFPSANRAKEREMEELAHRIVELETQCKMQDEDKLAAEAARCTSLKAIESLRTERSSLEQRVETADSSLRQSTHEIAEIRIEIAAAESAWKGDMSLITPEKESIAADTQKLEKRLAELSNDTTRQEKLLVLDAERARLNEVGRKLSTDLEEVQRQRTEEEPKVIELKAKLQDRAQRLELLTHQLAAAAKAIASHTINEPEFANRQSEHQDLMSKIAAVRSTQGNAEARKASLDQEARLAREEEAEDTTKIRNEISSLNEERVCVEAQRKDVAAGLTAIEDAVARAHAELTGVQGKSEDVSNALQHISGLEREVNDQLGAHNVVDHDRAIAQYQATTLEHEVETNNIKLSIESLEGQLEAAKARATQDQHDRVEVAKQELFMEVVSRKTGAISAAIEASRNNDLKAIQEEILLEDSRLRAACTDASQSPLGGGAEERLQLELSDLLGQKTVMESEVSSAESRVQRLKDNASRKDLSTLKMIESCAEAAS